MRRAIVCSGRGRRRRRLHCCFHCRQLSRHRACAPPASSRVHRAGPMFPPWMSLRSVSASPPRISPRAWARDASSRWASCRRGSAPSGPPPRLRARSRIPDARAPRRRAGAYRHARWPVNAPRRDPASPPRRPRIPRSHARINATPSAADRIARVMSLGTETYPSSSIARRSSVSSRCAPEMSAARKLAHVCSNAAGDIVSSSRGADGLPVRPHARAPPRLPICRLRKRSPHFLGAAVTIC